METSLFSSSPNSHRFEPPIRQFSNRSDLLYVPTLGTFLSYERSLLRSFGSPQLRGTCHKKTSKFSSGNVRNFQRKRQTVPAETSNFSSGNVKLFQRKRQTFPAETSRFSSHFMENAGMRLPFSCVGVDYDGPVSYTGSPRRPDEVVDRLARLDPCGIERSFLGSKGHAA